MIAVLGFMVLFGILFVLLGILWYAVLMDEEEADRIEQMKLQMQAERHYLAKAAARNGNTPFHGMKVMVDHRIPPGEVHLRQDGRTVARITNVK